MSRLLVIEDQTTLSDAMKRGLEAEGFEVDLAHDCATARQRITELPPELIVLDLLLPDGNGLDLLHEFREAGHDQPVIIVSAQDTVHQRIYGLDSGADDYLIKPFVFSELLARIRALLRRTPFANQVSLKCGDLHMDLISRTVSREGKSIELTNRQFDMLAYLARHQQKVVTREQLARDVWRDESTTWTNVIEVQVNRLRNKLDGRGQRALLHTIRGQGYLLGEGVP